MSGTEKPVDREPMPVPPAAVDLTGVRAFICDLDGVLTATARTHFRAWKRMFDEYLGGRPGKAGSPFTGEDYRRYVDGKPRYDGARSFLESRGIRLPEGDPGDPPERDTVCGLGNRKNAYFQRLLERDGVDRIEPSIAWAREAAARGMALAVVTSSRNGRRVLEAAGLTDLFPVRVDGVVGHELGLPGKPDPAYFLEAARRLGVRPGSAAVVEDAEAGVAAGRSGGFGLVVGIAPAAAELPDAGERLRAAGADVVVEDLSRLPLPPGAGEAAGEATATAALATAGHREGAYIPGHPIRDLPLLLDEPEVLDRLVAAGDPALFLDYDGTLTPIVDDPAAAVLPAATRAALERARHLFPVAIISGRDLDALRDFVAVDGIHYAGSHGLHIREPDGTDHQRARDWLPDLDRAESRLRHRLDGIPGAAIERKRFAIAVHYRNAPTDRVEEIQRIAHETAAGEERLVTSGGKKIVELRPDLAWDKGSAVRWILDLLDAPRPLRPLYIGDDVTDEDAFRALPTSGLPLVVRGESDDRRTAARYALTGPDQVRQVIERLCERVAAREEVP